MIYHLTSRVSLKHRIFFRSQIIVRSMSRRRVIELEEIPTLKQAYEEEHFSESNLTRSTKVKPLKNYEHNEEFNKKLSLIQADITKLKVDAIVNAANETLLGGGGVDGAIHRAAGHELRNECWDLNGCDTGDAKITKGYELPAKHVIHTVGPVGEKPHLLRSAYVRSLEVMTENNLRSIAFSNISTGVYGYPRGKAGHIALDTIRNWLKECTDLDKLDRIIFCVFEDDNKDVYETLFPLYFPPLPKIDNGEKEEKLSEEKKKEVDKNKEGEETHAISTSTIEHVKKLDKDKGEEETTDEQKDNKENIGKTDQDQVDTNKEKACVTEQKNGKVHVEEISQVDKKDEKTTTVNEQDEKGKEYRMNDMTNVKDKEEKMDENQDDDMAKTKINEQGTDKERIEQPKKVEENNQDVGMTGVQKTNTEESDPLEVKEVHGHKQGDTMATEKSSENRIYRTEQNENEREDRVVTMADVQTTNAKEVDEHKQGGIIAEKSSEKRTDGTEDVKVKEEVDEHKQDDTALTATGESSEKRIDGTEDVKMEEEVDVHKQDNAAVTATGESSEKRTDGTEDVKMEEEVDEHKQDDTTVTATGESGEKRTDGTEDVKMEEEVDGRKQDDTAVTATGESSGTEQQVENEGVDRPADEDGDVVMADTNNEEEDNSTKNNQNDAQEEKNKQHVEKNLTTKPEYSDTTDTSKETVSKNENVQEKTDGNIKDNEKFYGSNHHASL